MWNILNVKGPNESKNLNKLEKNLTNNNTQDERLKFLLRMSNSRKLMKTFELGQRMQGLTYDTSNA